MKNRNILKLILLIISSLLSYYFLFTTSSLYFYDDFNINYLFLLPFLIPLNIKLLKIKQKSKLIYLFTIINSLFLLKELIISLKIYFLYNDILIEYIYYATITYILIDNILNIKQKNTLTNDLLLSIISFFIIIIHIRYYFDNTLLHNLFNITNINNQILQNSYNYITNNYIYFIIMLLLTTLNQKISFFPIHKFH